VSWTEGVKNDEKGMEEKATAANPLLHYVRSAPLDATTMV